MVALSTEHYPTSLSIWKQPIYETHTTYETQQGQSAYEMRIDKAYEQTHDAYTKHETRNTRDVHLLPATTPCEPSPFEAGDDMRWRLCALCCRHLNESSDITESPESIKKSFRSDTTDTERCHSEKMDTMLEIHNVQSKKTLETMIKTDLYKTELCRNWEESGDCRYGSRCQFAHGHSELRNLLRHPKYKTSPCKTFMKMGSCPYGQRCCFSHIKEPVKPKTNPTTCSFESSTSPQTPLFLSWLSDLSNFKKRGTKSLYSKPLLPTSFLNQDFSGFNHLFNNINWLDEISPFSLG